jgi:hypothetical protein
MWSILYADNKDFQAIVRIGPFATEEAAMEDARGCQGQEFDIRDQHVYLLGPEHSLTKLCEKDFLLETLE